MVLDVIGLTLPYAMAIAMGPMPIIAAILVASSTRGRGGGWGFALGWTLGLIGLAVVVAWLLAAFAGTGQSAAWVNWARIVLGLLLLWAAVRKLGSKRDVDEAVTPKWLAMFDDVTAGRGVRLGATFAILNPKHLAFVAAAMSALSYQAGALAEMAGGILVFALLSAASVIVIPLAYTLGGSGVATRLEAVKQYMLRHSNIIVAVILALLGASILGSGIAGLSG